TRGSEFVVAVNEAGMKLGDDIRAADAAVWRRSDVGRPIGKLRSTAPLLAVEIAGQDEDEQVLRGKARWYLDHGVAIVWIVLPDSREVLVLRRDAESRYSRGERIAESPRLPGFAPETSRLFAQLDGA